jgi:hypothetical protein
MYIQVNQTPPTPSISQSGMLLTSNAPIGNLWHNHLGIIAGETGQTLQISQNGHYYTIVTLLGCPSDTSNIISVSIGMSEQSREAVIQIYPNPFTNELIITSSGTESPIHFELINALGQIVTNGTFTERHVIQTDTYGKGVYVVRLNDGRDMWIQKVIKR